MYIYIFPWGGDYSPIIMRTRLRHELGARASSAFVFFVL